MLPRYQHILHPTDLSENSRLAMQHAVALAVCHNATVNIVHVVPDLVDLMSEDAGLDIEANFDSTTWKQLNATALSNAKEKARQRVSEMTAACLAQNTKCPEAEITITVLTGDPAGCIVDSIPGHDLIVMGAHGRGRLADMILGSVASKIIRLSPVPVLTVRLPTDQNTACTDDRR